MYNPRMWLPLMWVSLASIAGMFLASAIQAHVAVWALLALLAPSATIAVRRRAPAVVPLRAGMTSLTVRRELLVLAVALLTGTFVGAARFQLSVAVESPGQVSFYNDAGHDVLVSGMLITPPDVRDKYTNLRLQVDSLDAGDGQAPVRGLILARIDSLDQLEYGDHVRLRGRLATPPSKEDFSYRDYLARQGIRSYMPSAAVTLLPEQGGSLVLRLIYRWKAAALRNVYRLFLDPEASLLAGILLGVDTGLPTRLRQPFNDTGTSHIIAISGFNIAVIAGALVFVFGRLLGPRLGAAAAAIGIIFYTVFVGADPPVFRAALMGLIGLLALQIGRRQVGVYGLVLVATFMAFVNPLFLWDVGFQLSVMATLGLIAYGGAFMDAARGLIDRLMPASTARLAVSSLVQFTVLTFAAQLTTLPIMAYHFRQISLVSLVANAFVLPVQPAVMVLGGAAVFASLLIYPIGQLLAWAAWPFVTYTIRLVELFASVPNAVIYLGGFSMAAAILFYGILLATTVAGSNIMDFLRLWKPRLGQVAWALGVVALLAIGILIWRLLTVAPDGQLHVTFMDVGSADAIFIQGPTGARVLINGGPSANSVSDSLGRRMSPFDHHLDWLVVASTDEEQVAALPTLLPRFPPDEVLLGAPAEASLSSVAMMERLTIEQTPITRAEVGHVLQLGGGAELKVLDLSSRGSTLLLEWGSFRMLLPVGANLDTLQSLELGEAVGPVGVLLLAQSGYAPLAPPEWLQALNPDLVAISVGVADMDGLPSPETLEALDGYSVLRTDQNGWIHVSTDGSKMWVSSERPVPQ